MAIKIYHEVTIRVVNGDENNGDRELLHNIFTLTKSIHNKTSNIMATIEQFELALSRIDTATTNIADELRDLKDQIAGGGLSAELEASVLARLEAKATQLEEMSQTVENPVPEVPPTEGQPGSTGPSL